VTRLVCVCGVVVEGSEEGLLEAVERHLVEAHAGELRGPAPRQTDVARPRDERLAQSNDAKSAVSDESGPE